MKKYIVLLLLLKSSFLVVAQDAKYTINSLDIIRQGIKQHDAGKYKEAILEYEKVPENDTNYVLSLFEISLSARIDSQYTKAKDACKKGIEIKENEYLHDFYINWANTLDDEKKYDSATIIFDKSIELFPKSFLTYHAKGINMYLKQNYDSAMYYFKKVVVMNPFAFNSHYYLGLIAKEKGYPIQAMLSFAMNLAISPNNTRSGLSIQHLYALANLNDSVIAKFNNRKKESYFTEDYTELETYFKSKIALEKGYEVKTTFNESFIKQLHLIIEKLPTEYKETEFWNAFYAPPLKEIFAAKLYDALTLRMIASVNNEEVQSKVKKEKSAIEKMYELLEKEISKVGYFQSLNKEDYKKDQAGFIYEENKPVAFGKIINNDKKNLEGEWTFLNIYGEKKITANYKKGVLDGNYKYYFLNNNLQKNINYTNDKLNGEAIENYNNGLTKIKTTLKDGKQNGLYQEFFSNGNLESEIVYVNGIKEGPSRNYYKSGELKYEFNYKNDLIEGTLKEYYINGKLYSTTEYVKGKSSGNFVSYYLNGKEKEKGNMQDGLREGLFLQYDDFGNLSGKQNYKKGKLDGETFDYFENGTIQKKGIYSNGDEDGEFTNYYENGNITDKIVYKNGRIKKVSFYNILNNQLIYENEITSKDKNDLKIYNEIGCLKKDIVSDREGYFNGENTDYYIGGNKEVVSNWKKGKQEGKYTAYHMNGKIKSEYQYSNDELNGTYKAYNLNGILTDEGEFVNDNREGYTYTYNDFGNMYEKEYYIHGAKHGPQYYYHANGKIAKKVQFDFGEETNIIQYDTNGKIILNTAIKPNTPNEITELNPVGKPSRKFVFKNNYLIGKQETYYPDKTIASVYYFKAGLLDSLCTNYFYNGKIKSQGSYVLGNKEGRWVYYDKDGGLYNVSHYHNDINSAIDTFYNEDGSVDIAVPLKENVRHGWLSKYAPSGELMYKYNYVRGLIVSYTYEKPDGTLMPEIPVENSNKLVELKTFYKNGQISAVGGYQNGDYEGKRILYYPNGKEYVVATYKNGNKEGEMKEFHTNGNLKLTYNYINDDMDGLNKTFNENNLLIKEEKYIKGYLNGPQKYYDKNGKLEKIITYYWGSMITIE